MENRQYQGVQLSKKESELVAWLQKGEHDWYQAFYMYANRRKSGRIAKNGTKERSWFNRTLSRLHKKNLCLNIPFIMDHIKWRNPGITANKANFAAITLQETNYENRAEFQRAVVI
jgi:hypothetical protein